MHAVEAADDEAIDHVHHRLRDGVVDRLERRHAFLDDDGGDGEALLHDGHLVALLAIQVADIVDAAHRHDAHAVRARVRLDDDERLLADPVLRIFGGDARKQLGDVGREAFLARPLMEIDLAARVEARVDEPRIDADQRGELLGHGRVRREVMRLFPVVPAGGQRRNHGLVDALQYRGRPGGKVVIEQHHARIEIGQVHAAAIALHYAYYNFVKIHQTLRVTPAMEARL